MANARRKLYEKARNIVRNNIDKTSRLTPNFGAKNAHLVIKAYDLFQKSRAK